MTDITIATLTNKTTNTVGTGVFDVLMESMLLHLEAQYQKGRIKGTEYATVYLGSLQSVLSESLKFLLEEQLAEKQVDLLTEQIATEQEKRDLIIAQTAESYEKIAASQQDTVRANLINAKTLLKLDAEIAGITAQTAEAYENIAASQQNTIRADLINAKTLLKLDAEITGIGANTDLINQKILGEKTQQQTIGFTAQAKLDKELGFAVTQNITYPWDIDNITAATDGMIDKQIDEEIKKTLRSDAESSQKVSLMAAQTLGFKSDTKQKTLKQMFDGYAVNQSIVGGSLIPSASVATQIDTLTKNILTEVGASEVMP